MSAGPTAPRPYSRWLGLLAVLLVFAFMGLAAAVGKTWPLPRRADRQTFAMAAMLGGMLAGAAVAVTFAVLVLRRNAAVADEALSAIGLAGSSLMLRGRQGHGTYAGRPVHAYYFPGHRNRPATLELFVGSPLRTRLAVGPRSAVGAWLRGLVGGREMHVADPTYAHLAVSAADERWALGVLRHPEARDAILRLTADPSGGQLRYVRIDPETVQIRVAGASIYGLDGALVRGLTDDLVRLAYAAESLPPPLQATEAGGLERAQREARGSLGAKIALGLVFGLLVPMAIVLAIVAFLALRR